MDATAWIFLILTLLLSSFLVFVKMTSRGQKIMCKACSASAAATVVAPTK